MNQLQAEYGEEIEFVYLDVDDPVNRQDMRRFDIQRQSEYVLFDGASQVARWFGPLDEELVANQFSSVIQ